MMLGRISWVVSLALGVVLSVASAPRIAAQSNVERPRYLLLLFEDASFGSRSATPQTQRVAEYRAWADELDRAGQLVSGEKLTDDGIVIEARRQQPESWMDMVRRPGGAVAGYFVIHAADTAEATRIAGTCPHVKHGGWVSVRRIDRHSARR